MRVFAVFFALVALAAATPTTTGQNIISTINDEGKVVTEDLDKPVLSTFAVDMNELHFMLYTASNPDTPYELKYGDVQGLQKSPFDASRPTRFLIHGWQGSYTGPSMQVVKDAFTESLNVNVILGDYKKYNAPYLTAVGNAKTIGCKFANFLDYLVSNGLRLKDLHIIGHSLGAHISGFTANCMTSGAVPRITGMDPAGPLYGDKGPADRLSPEDATFVDILHTSTTAGMAKATGTADFYPHGGADQTGCSDGSCDHMAACNYYALSLTNPRTFPARACKDEKEAKVQDPAKNLCVASAAYMGEPALATSSPGIYYVAY